MINSYKKALGAITASEDSKQRTVNEFVRLNNAKRESKIIKTKTKKFEIGRRIIALALSGVFAIGITFGVLAVAGVFAKSGNIINPTSITLSINPFELGKNKASLETKIEPSNADKSVKWSSSNTSVVKVSKNGTIDVVRAGSATIKAKTRNNLTETCSVIVDDFGNVEMKVLDSTLGDLINIGIINDNPKSTSYSSAGIKDFNDTFTFANGYRISAAVYNLFLDAQVEALNRFIEMDIDYVLLSAVAYSNAFNPWDPASDVVWDVPMDRAKAAGIPVITFGRLIYNDKYTAAVVNDFSEEGKTAVDWLLNQGLDEINVLHLQGILGDIAQIGRSSALETANAEGKLNIVKQETANWGQLEAKQIVQNAIKDKLSFNVIYAENDDMALYAAIALDEAGITHGIGGDVIIISFNAHTWALNELLAGRWNFNVQCSPFMSSAVHEIIQSFENGVEITEKIVYIKDLGFDARTITEADVDKYGLEISW